MALVLYTGTSPSLAETRRLLLEDAGHLVFIALEDSDIAEACQKHRIEVAVIGHTGEAELKRGRLAMIRKARPSAKVLELVRQNSSPVLDAADASIEIGHPDIFLASIAGLARRS